MLGLFFFWGWDTAVNLNEESKKLDQGPRPSEVCSRCFCCCVGGTWTGYLMIIAVLSSTVADTQTTLLPAARITLSMARDGVFPRVFGIIHGKFQTPMIGTLILAFVALLGILLRASSPTVNSVYGNLIDNIGVMVAFYYGATGIACAWAYRKVMFNDATFFFTGILLPFLAGVFCFWVGYEVVRKSGLRASAPVLIAVALGIPLVIVTRLRTKSEFFEQEPIAYDSTQ